MYIRPIEYSERLSGAKATTIKDGAPITDNWWNHANVEYLKKGQYVILTGYYWYDGLYTNYAQTTDGWYIVSDTYDGTNEYWQVTEGASKPHVYTQSQAQALVQKIIKNNKTITRCNILCARYAGSFTKTQLAQIKELQQRVVARDKALQDEGLTKDVRTGYPEEYAELSSYLDQLMEDQSIGLATWVVVVIAATVIAATATAAYFAYKSLADESERDVKFSKELTASLVNKLSPEEYQQLLDETKGLLTKSKIKSLVRGSWGTVKIAAAVVGAYTIYKIIKSKL